MKVTEMVSDELISIGRVIGPHGVKGTLKLQVLTDYPQRFHEMSRISLYTKEGNPVQTLTIKNIRILESKGYLLIDTEEIDDRDKADALRGSVVMIPSSERYSLSSGEYWVDEIIGLDVVNSLNGEVIGKVVNIIDVGENDLYQILTLNEEERFIPAVSQFISKIDIAKGCIYVNVIEGLLD